jgi:glucose/arabinose dehydrogenase
LEGKHLRSRRIICLSFVLLLIGCIFEQTLFLFPFFLRASNADNSTVTKSNDRLINASLAAERIKREYTDLGGNKSFLEAPISNVMAATDHIGYFQLFNGGVIYWTSHTGPHEIHGSIYEKWKDLGLERSPLGYPISDIDPTSDKTGYYSVFENGAIYWTPYTGAHEVHSSIYEKWKDLGLERSTLGYPVTDQMSLPGNGVVVYFEGGSIWWYKKTGPYEVHSKDYLDYIKSKSGHQLNTIANKTILLSPANMNNNTTATTSEGIPTTDKNVVALPIAKGIRFPTSMAFLGQNDILVLEKDYGTVRRIINGDLVKEPLLDVNVATKGERGMLGIAIANDAKTLKPTYVFLYYTESSTKDGQDLIDGKEPLGNRLYRYEFNNDYSKLVNPKLLLDIPTTPAAVHNGGKVLIGPDDNVYLVVGDLFSHHTKSQNNIHGSEPDGTSVVYRINQRGEAVNDSPFSNSPHLSKYYAYGMRNSFGIDFDPISGNLWDTENGVDNFDEINLVQPGFNSGWRAIQGLAKDNSSFNLGSLVKLAENGGYRDPEFVWNQTVGLTAIKFLSSDTLGKQYQNDAFVGDIYGDLYHFKLNKQRTAFILDGKFADKEVSSPEEREQIVFAKFGGITDMEVSPDGHLYVASIQSYYPTIERQGTIYKLISSHQTGS